LANADWRISQHKTIATSLNFSNDGKLFATMAKDRQVRIFKFLSGKLHRKYDESLAVFNQLQKDESVSYSYRLDTMEFGRRLTVEAEIDNSERTPASNVIFDESGNFILYSTMLGVKVVNILENKIDKILGKSESNLRFLTIGLYQGKIKGSVAAENLQRNAEQDPTLFCTAFKQQRFYMITRRDPYQEEDSEIGRDVFNERPSKAEASLLAKPATRKLGRSAILHTTMGDIHIKLFPEESVFTYWFVLAKFTIIRSSIGQ